MIDLVTYLRAISQWADRADWRSWLFHSLVAAVLVAPAGAGIFHGLVALGVSSGLAAAVSSVATTFGTRELEQALWKYMAGVRPRLRDPIMDVVTPVVAVLVLGLIIF